MGEAAVARGAVLNRSMYSGSARKDNAEEVARRRAAMQQQIEQRQQLARRLQDEKMARAVAQKEEVCDRLVIRSVHERLQKQREAQQRDMLRAKAVLDRRAQALAEEEEKKEAVLAKVHAVASRLSAQNKVRPVYAFGSSTPRELGYLTHLTKEQKVYDRKLTPSDRSPTGTSGSSGRLTTTPPNGSRGHMSSAPMTRSMYVARSEIKKRQKPVPNCMTQSVLVTPKSARVTGLSQTPVHRPSTARRAPSAAMALTSSVRRSDLPKTTKILAQCPPLQGRKSQTAQPQPSKKIEVPKSKPIPRRAVKPPVMDQKETVKAQIAQTKSLHDAHSNGTFVILEKENVNVPDNAASAEVKNEVDAGKVSLVSEGEVAAAAQIPSENGITAEVPKEEFVAEDRIKVVAEERNVVECDSKMEDEIDAVAVVQSPKEVNFEADNSVADREIPINETFVVDSVEADDHVDMEASKSDLKSSGDTNAELKDAGEEGNVVEAERRDIEIPMHEVEEHVAAADDEGQKKAENDTSETTAREASLAKENDDASFKEESVAKAEDVGETDVPAVEAIRTEPEIPSAQGPSSAKTSTDVIAEDPALMGEKILLEERRRAQEERLEREQRERELRKAKLASIMSRTRGGLPPMAVVSPTTQSMRNPEVMFTEFRKFERIVFLQDLDHEEENAVKVLGCITGTDESRGTCPFTN
ncbi:unnamed protein product [Gongylonema pulchrum]|uniref:CKK domain-containing protein n=1 Tax=Gongylonema pulchrum TaxID=637853 RepID=A0A183DQG6_9BILA|nr:unnamed protein product [Gongylonema pulchrum]